MSYVKTIVNIDFATQFAENRIYSVTSNLETRGKYDDDNRIVYLERHGEDRCKFVESGKNAEQIIFEKLQSCFVPSKECTGMARNLLNNKE